MGVPDRVHYASSPDNDLISSSRAAVREAAAAYTDMLVYLFPLGEEDANKEAFTDIKNLVLLMKDDNV